MNRVRFCQVCGMKVSLDDLIILAEIVGSSEAKCPECGSNEWDILPPIDTSEAEYYPQDETIDLEGLE